MIVLKRMSAPARSSSFSRFRQSCQGYTAEPEGRGRAAPCSTEVDHLSASALICPPPPPPLFDTLRVSCSPPPLTEVHVGFSGGGEDGEGVEEERRRKGSGGETVEACHAWALSVGYYIWLEMIKCD